MELGILLLDYFREYLKRIWRPSTPVGIKMAISLILSQTCVTFSESLKTQGIKFENEANESRSTVQ